MALEQRMYRDPLQVLLADEAKTCKGCVHEVSGAAWGVKLWVCTTKNEQGKRRNHGRRCKDYKEKCP